MKFFVVLFLLSQPLLAETLTETWYMTQGRTNFGIGNYKAAGEAFAKATTLNPKNDEAWKSLGASYERQGLIDQAVVSYDKYLLLRDDDSQVAFRQANILTWKRYEYRRTDAIKYFQMGFKAKDDRMERRRYAKFLAQDKKNVDDAAKEYRRMVAESPNDEQLKREYRELLLWDKKHIDEAIAAFEDEVRKSPQDQQSKRSLAILYFSSTRHDEEGLVLSQSLLAANPADHQLRLNQARALSRQGRLASAQGAFREVLKRNDQIAIREEYANLLAKDKGQRDETMKQYRLVLKAQPKNDRVRLQFAQVLGSDKGDLKEAIAEYNTIVERNSKNAEAHAGLAKAYAWIGNKDQAIYHNNLASQYGYRKKGEASTLDLDLHKGREPFVGPTFGYYYDERDNLLVQSFFGAVRAGKDLTPFATVSIEGGMETYTQEDSGNEKKSATGGLARGRFEYRFSEKAKLSAKYGFHSVGQPGSTDEWEGRVRFQGEQFSGSLGAEHDLVRDSIFAIKGEQINGVEHGAARRTLFYLELEGKQDKVRYRLKPHTGYVETRDGGKNDLRRLEGKMDYTLTHDDALRWFLLAEIDGQQFGKDPTEVTETAGFGGGYDAEELSARIALKSGVSWELTDAQFFYMDMGPSFHHLNPYGDGTRREDGGCDMRFYWQYRVDHDFHTELQAHYMQISNRQRRFDIQAMYWLLF